MEIDWYMIGLEDQCIQDGLDTEIQEPRFITPPLDTIIPKAEKGAEYNAFDTMSKADIEVIMYKENHY